MLLPLSALLILFVYELASRGTDGYVNYIDRHEGTHAKRLSEQLGPLVEGQLREKFEELQRENPGWWFAAFRQDNLLASTIPLSPRHINVIGSIPAKSPSEPGRDLIADIETSPEGGWYWLTVTQVPAWPEDARLASFYSVDHASELDDQAHTRVHAVASVTVALLIVAATWFSGGLSRRVRRIQRQVSQIAEGDFQRMVEEHGRDEVGDLARAVNSMAAQLQQMQAAIEQTERSRLQAQVAGGIAHELRNGIHSARLSLEVFEEHHQPSGASPGAGSDSMLDNALGQLRVTEMLVRRLLAIGKAEIHERVRRPLKAVLDEVAEMVRPMCLHAEVAFEYASVPEGTEMTIGDSEAVRAAILNLCLNGMEAAGRGGSVELQAVGTDNRVEVRVSDSGPGPAPEVSENLFEPFVTTKPEGIGLGLVLARQAIENENGALSWYRNDGRTVFMMSWQVPQEVPQESGREHGTHIDR